MSQEFPTPLTVKVTDQRGNPRLGTSVSFAVMAGSASFSGSRSLLVVTDALGGASATLTAGATPGEVSVTATVAGLPAVGFVQTVEASSPTRADLAVSVTVPTSLSSRGTGTVSVAVTNAGPHAASPVLGAVRLPTELAVTSSTPGAQRVGSTLLFRTATLAAGEGVAYTVRVRNMTRDRKFVSVFAAALSPVKDPSPANNTATANIRLD